MADHTVIEAVWVEGEDHGRRSAADEAVEHYGNPRHSCGDDRPDHGAEFSSAEGGQQGEGVSVAILVPGDSGGNDGGFAGELFVVHAGAAPDPVACLAAEQTVAEGGGGGTIADAHFSEAEEIDAGLDRHHAVGEGGHGLGLGHGGCDREVRRRVGEVEFIDPQVGVKNLAQLVDRRASLHKVSHHLLGYRRRIGRNPLGGNAVVASKDRDPRMVTVGRRRALPSRQPDCELLESAETSGGLQEL